MLETSLWAIDGHGEREVSEYGIHRNRPKRGLSGAAQKIEDDRGHFARAWCREEFQQHGLNPNMVQLNVGFSHRRGTVRGMHYQLPPHAEAKFIRCTRARSTT